MAGRVKVAMAAPRGRPCGIGDHAMLLAAALEPRCDITWVDLPQQSAPAAWREAASVADGADVVHVHFEPALFFLPSPRMNRFATFMRRVRAPALVSLHGAMPDLGTPPDGNGSRGPRQVVRLAAVRALRVPWERAQYRRASQWLVHSPDLAAAVAAVAGTEHLSFHQLPVPPVERVWSASDDHPIDLVSPGFVKAHKGYLDLLHTVAGLSDLRWLLAGGPQDEYDRRFMAQFSSAMNELGLSSRVSVTGYLARERLEALALQAKVAIFPFEHAAGSASLTWAIALGLPILATDLPGLSQFREAGAGIVLLPRSNRGRWPALIESLLRNPHEQARLSGLNIEFAKSHGYADLASHVEEIYRRQCGAGSAR